ncbi:MAG: hypothetical protein MUC35_03930 [Candidatus Margulisbacteria bacterium]|nr:hypothetical protein [Candidatus Margulisiibacteriota bacterium]
MAGMGNILVLTQLLTLGLALGFAYIIWILATKETGNLKLGGQILAAVIALLALLIFIYGLVVANQMQRSMQGGMGGMMMGGKMGSKMEMPCAKSGMTEKEKMECMRKMMEGKK